MRKASSSSGSSPPSEATSQSSTSTYLSRSVEIELPEKQSQLVIDAAKQPFRLTNDAAVPEVLDAQNELLIRIESIGLNPIDWKSPAFGFGLPSLPCVLGRDFVGTVIKAPVDATGDPKRHIRQGDVVLAVSTDYRDYRKAAFQEYAVSGAHNVCRLSSRLDPVSASIPAVGVAFVSAALSLGVCLGLDFSGYQPAAGPDLYSIVRASDRTKLAEDIREECFDSLPTEHRIKAGDWIVVWGASSTVGFFTAQLAKRAGLKVIAVADLTKNGSRLLDLGLDALVHRADPDEAVRVIRSLTAGKRLRYGLDAVGKDTAALLHNTFDSHPSHLVCLVASPKDPEIVSSGVKFHKLPMKLFHESPAVGQALMTWLEDLLASEDGLVLPRVDVHGSKGLESVPPALDRLRANEFSGRIVVEM